MRVAIDWKLCVGSGLCVGAAPGVFGLVPQGVALRAGVVGCGRPEDLIAAARACPTLAITLWDEAGTILYPPRGEAIDAGS